MEEKLLTEKQASRVLNLSPKTLYRLRKAGKLQFVKIGMAIRYEFESLVAFVNVNRVLV